MQQSDLHDKQNSNLSSSEETPPPLPARPSVLLTASPNPRRPQLQSKATTGISRAEVQGHAVGASNGNPQVTVQSSSPRSTKTLKQASRASSVYGDRASITSTINPSVRDPEYESLFDDFLPDHDGKGQIQTEVENLDECLKEQETSLFPDDGEFEAEFQHEFEDVQANTTNEGKEYHSRRNKQAES